MTRPRIHPQTQWCEDCLHARYDYDWRKNSFVCMRGHTPRFYAPNPESVRWGYKRKCADFKPVRAENGDR